MDDLISRQAALDIFDDYNVAVENGNIEAYTRDRKRLLALPSAQPVPCEDAVSRKAAIDALKELTANGTNKGMVFGEDAVHRIEMLPPAQPAQHIDADGTLWITVTDIEQVKRVIVDEDKSKFCRQFYMDAKPEPCEDAVSRQAIINALDEQLDYLSRLDVRDNPGVENKWYGINWSKNTIAELPPVTPKQRTDLLKDEIKRMKRSFTTCINSDYYTGYMSALSAVEGYIAQSEGDAE